MQAQVSNKPMRNGCFYASLTMRLAARSSGPVSSQYAAAAIVPLIKAPTLWLPRPVRLAAESANGFEY